ncbi:MAG: glycosyltransferase family 2 protein [Bacteroidales bacterium]|nr:glycosyltransferase family 2 protein [Bacteroidales bacterium]
MPSENKISVVIHTYNAEKELPQTLDSVRGFDEIVVCDMESTDNTLAVAEKYGCRIITFPKKDYTCPEPARTFAIQSATYDWVLVVDADEIVTPQLHDYLYDTIKNENCPAGFWIPRKNFFMGKFMHSDYPDYQLRFFKKEGTTWPPFAHTSPSVQGDTVKIPKKRKELALIHLADTKMIVRMRKMNGYTESEVEKRAGRHYTFASLFFRPCLRFVKSYIIKGGFLDGKAGYINAKMDAFYQFVLISKILEKKYGKK